MSGMAGAVIEAANTIKKPSPKGRHESYEGNMGRIILSLTPVRKWQAERLVALWCHHRPVNPAKAPNIVRIHSSV